MKERKERKEDGKKGSGEEIKELKEIEIAATSRCAHSWCSQWRLKCTLQIPPNIQSKTRPATLFPPRALRSLDAVPATPPEHLPLHGRLRQLPQSFHNN